MRRELIGAVLVAIVMVGSLLGLTRVFSDSSWVGLSLASIGLSVVIAAGARRIGFGAVGSALGSLVGLVVFTYVVHLPAGPLIPGPEQFGQAADLLSTGVMQLRDEPAPTTPLPGLMLIVTTGVWATAHLAHELLVRWRRPGLALIPPMVLWAVPLAMPQAPGQTWRHTLPFLATCGLLLLLESDSDVAAWARDRQHSRLSAAGAGVAGIALVVAGLAPGLLPGYESSAWIELVGGTDPTGYQPIVDVGDRLQLPDPRPVLRVESPRPVYLRLAGLDTFDTNTWRLGPPGSTSYQPEQSELFSASQPLPPEVPITDAEEVLVSVEVIDLENIYVPVPYQPERLVGPARGDMVYSRVGGFVATGEISENEIGGRLRPGVVAGLQYSVVSQIPDPDPSALRDLAFDTSAIEPYTRLPGANDGRYRQYVRLADQLYRDAAATTVLDRVLALQSWFTSSEFTYSLTDIDALRGASALESFVFDTRTGYCEYFATAMAVMLRATGIPARVAVGFLPGDVVVPADPVNGVPATYEVSTQDAHAWVEVLFPGYGWIKFDPTPRGDGATMAPTADELDPLLTEAQRQDINENDELSPEEQASDPSALPSDAELPPGLLNDEELSGGAGNETGGGLPLVPIAVLLLALVGVALVVSSRRLSARHPELPDDRRVLAAQRRLLVSARRFGVGRRPAETAVDLARRWAEEGRVDPTVAAEFAGLAQSAAFGGDLPPGAGERAEDLVDDLVVTIRGSVMPADRMLAPVRQPLEVAADAGRGVAEQLRALVGSDRD